MSQTKCEGGCGNIPEVYGSSWCAWCHDNIPYATQVRIIEMRNALWNIAMVGTAAHRHKLVRGYRELARAALQQTGV